MLSRLCVPTRNAKRSLASASVCRSSPKHTRTHKRCEQIVFRTDRPERSVLLPSFIARRQMITKPRQTLLKFQRHAHRMPRDKANGRSKGSRVEVLRRPGSTGKAPRALLHDDCISSLYVALWSRDLPHFLFSSSFCLGDHRSYSLLRLSCYAPLPASHFQVTTRQGTHRGMLDKNSDHSSGHSSGGQSSDHCGLCPDSKAMSGTKQNNARKLQLYTTRQA